MYTKSKISFHKYTFYLVASTYCTNIYIQIIYIYIYIPCLSYCEIVRLNTETVCTITSKINATPKDVYLAISKMHKILIVANLLSHNNKSQICYCDQISLLSGAVNCSFSDKLTPLKERKKLLTLNLPLFKGKFPSDK